MAIRNLYHRPVLIMTEIDLQDGPWLTWIGAGDSYSGGHDGVAIPGACRVWKCLGRQLGPVFLGAPTTVHPDGRVTGLMTFPLRDPAAFCHRHPEWSPLYDVALRGNDAGRGTAVPRS